MLGLRIATYALTSASALLFAFWEVRLRRQLTEPALAQQHESVSDYADLSYDIRQEIRRERVLTNLPPGVKFRLKVIAGLKFLFLAILVVEVIILQRG